MANIFVGMETSGTSRRAFAARGAAVISCDTLPADDDDVLEVELSTLRSGGPKFLAKAMAYGKNLHIVGDVFETLKLLKEMGWVPDAGLFHPTCTLHTVAAAWAFNEPDFIRYPGVGYHQKVKPETLTGAARHKAREIAEAEVERVADLEFFKVIENPRNTWSTRTSLEEPCDVLQPYEFGEDASKATCIWAFDGKGNRVKLSIRRQAEALVAPTLRPRTGKYYWANQTDTGQNRLSPSDDRWKDRSKTYPGIADALAEAILSHLKE